MKKIFTIAALMFVVFSVNAQKYMRYHMSDSTFFGFYTESVDSMMHTPSFSTVYMGGNLYEIPLDKVDSITFEGVSVYDENVIGKYRIYEIESDTLSYRKAYIDNRAMMIASRTGEFGANDTILVASEYYKTKWLIMTNNDGNVEKFFDGISLYYFDYHDDESFTVLHIEDSLFAPIDFYLENSVNKSRKQAKGIIANFNNKKFGKFVDDYYSEKYKEKFDGFNDALEGLMGFLEDIDNNPEFHNQKLILNGLEIGSDIWGVGRAVGRAFATGGLAWWLVLAEAGVLMNDINGLYEELYPNNEQMKIYTEYYQNKYNILARTEKAANITYSGATLKGTLTTLENQHGRVYFRYHKFQGLEDSKIVEATLTPMTDGEWLIEAPVTDLELNTTYLYDVLYECKVDGLLLLFSSKDFDEFTTSGFPGKIRDFYLTKLKHQSEEEKPNKAYFDVTGTLYETNNIEEWGVYFPYDDDTLLFKFPSVHKTEVKSLILSSTDESANVSIDYNRFIFKAFMTAGLYLKRRKCNGELAIYYGNSDEYTIKYEQKPSFKFTDYDILETTVVETEEVESDDGNFEIHLYRTYSEGELVVKGNFWTETVFVITSGNGWDRVNESATDGWAGHDDGTCRVYIDKYYWCGHAGTIMSHAFHYELHLRNSRKVVNSNYLYFSGEEYINSVDILSGSSNFTNRKTAVGQKLATNVSVVKVRDTEQSHPQYTIKKIYEVEDCSIADIEFTSN
ncbi:MAG: hypothetical protein IJE15_02455 [Bacteroidaceae bacterium]|nr:hypothetical protein [Bacteroidaceae bacterium]